MADPSVQPVPLALGVEQPSPTLEESRRRVAVLRATVEKYLPDFVKLVQQVVADSAGKKEGGKGFALLHQDAFAAGYDADEYTLMGMAVKYAGMSGVEVHFFGTNHETF